MGTWPDWLLEADIAVKELVAVVVPLQVRAQELLCRCIIVRSNNSSVVKAINAQSSRSADVMVWLRLLFQIIVKHDILLRAVHVAGKMNRAPDALSRGSTQVFRSLRPDAEDAATVWDWATFDTLRQ